MKKIGLIGMLMCVFGCDNSARNDTPVRPATEQVSVFYCERQPQLNKERGCHLNENNAGCTDQVYNHGGCFEQQTAYCYTHSLSGFEQCVKFGYKLTDQEFDKCVFGFHGWSGISTETECLSTLDECVSAHNEIANATPAGKQPISSPPVLTLCRLSRSNEVSPF
jgi:hypothetical protein